MLSTYVARPAAKPKLLIVDDEPAIVEFVGKVLMPFASGIRCAYDGHEAVSIARDFRPDCVVTGLMMPVMNGFDEAVQILRFLPDCKFVFMSGSAHNPAVREEYQRAGFDLLLLLNKPFEAVDLLNRLALTGFPCK
jgi:two-component system response regulator YesN